MPRFRALDLFCGAGGASRGYALAGFDVLGVDVASQKRYPYAFLCADALSLSPSFLAYFDLIHASPPCQGYTEMRAPNQRGAPLLIEPLRALLHASGRPYIIENVEGAREALLAPLLLCGTMFGLGAHGCELQRHRLFESNKPLIAPKACAHSGGPVVGVYGDHARIRSGAERHKPQSWPETHREVMNRALGTDWLSAHDASEAIPPVYTRWLGAQIKERLS